jgi:hypothetical protein
MLNRWHFYLFISISSSINHKAQKKTMNTGAIFNYSTSLEVIFWFEVYLCLLVYVATKTNVAPKTKDKGTHLDKIL